MIYDVVIMWVSYSGTLPAACDLACACSAFGRGERQLVRPSVRFYRCWEYESERKRRIRFLHVVIIERDSGD